ncbi:uncharacterized protein LOC119580790 [Penaeus monodon]|uniref:uncharacterized protein LOC119580790 n=1 Tax=Penaeus monodon TaxID=6687 RepID=UPI0018A728ED|nr:uncharacterized protein LOC119580790 [Penaeus monodon]
MLSLPSKFRWRAGILFLLGSICLMLSFSIFSGPAYPFNVPQHYEGNSAVSRRQLARRLLQVQRQIDSLAGMQGKVDAAWSRELLAVAEEIDPRVSSEDADLPIQDRKQQRNSREITISDKAENGSLPPTVSPVVAVCPEVYLGREADVMYQSNFRTVECTNALAFKDLVTVILSTKGWEVERVKFVARQILKHYDVNIYILVFGINEKIDVDNTIIKHYSSGVLESKAINSVLSYINTPYIFLTSTLTHFSEQSPLDRLVRVLDDLHHVGVATGAYRDLKGLWHHGCLQATMENYQLSYERGYEHSKDECMYCDDALGPMLLKTELLVKVPMKETLEGSVMYRDWFLNVRLTGSLVVACPDLMFFVDTEPVMVQKDWLRVAQIWSVQYIHPYDGEELEFSCEQAEIKCNNLLKSVALFLVPPCCKEKLRYELGLFQDCAEELGLYYELQAGSLLGAVKTDGLLPWDFDTDTITDCKDQSIWLSDGMKCMKRKGCSSKLIAGNYWTSTCEQSTIDITCRHNTTIYLPKEYRQIPTQIMFDGRKTWVKANPGRVARNMYGHEYLKHAAHWRHVSLTGKDDGSGGVGSWKTCKEPGFHACLDHFPVDGNLKFKWKKQKN